MNPFKSIDIDDESKKIKDKLGMKKEDEEEKKQKEIDKK